MGDSDADHFGDKGNGSVNHCVFILSCSYLSLVLDYHLNITGNLSSM